ncbi:replication protein A 70 kDa DNA-binding subunit-like [Panicum miliaceum]|uniref:Replication protein A 70 kDa DNA-binding subunit-like n=1 Tax=Panicum miliaceum TaxID=4540 RepID=A0A3L6STI8_PANMI|nr:replication protein A 70 kDa DNA-binding subunit-like [Panicum miliaceum]
MAYTLLPQLHPHEKISVICVYVARKWEYRGPTDDGPVQHVDLVLADEKGNTIYAEIPPTQIDKHASTIQENGIYVMSRFKVANLKNSYRPVHASYMIELTCFTKINIAKDPPSTFPKYMYNLVEFDDLYNFVGDQTYFLDVLGVIIEVNQPEWRPLSNQPKPALTRNLIIRNIEGNDLKLTLWGRRASEFNVDDVYNPDDPKPIVSLFVGCLMKSYMKQEYLSGSSACKWYFNPQIPEAVFLNSKLAVAVLSP